MFCSLNEDSSGFQLKVLYTRLDVSHEFSSTVQTTDRQSIYTLAFKIAGRFMSISLKGHTASWIVGGVSCKFCTNIDTACNKFIESLNSQAPVKENGRSLQIREQINKPDNTLTLTLK